MKVSRRDFIKISAGTGAAVTFLNRDILKQATAIITQGANKNLVWLQGQSCSGCTISALQWVGDYDGSYETNFFDVIGANGVSGNATNTDLEFHPMLMPQAGAFYSDNGLTYSAYGLDTGNPMDENYVNDVIDYLRDKTSSEKTYCVVEGAVPYDKWGDNEAQGFCVSGLKNLGGTYKEGHFWTVNEIVKELAPDVEAFIAFGTCATFGGIPGGTPNPTGAKGLQHFLEDVTAEGGQFKDSIDMPTIINLFGCPAHPEHLILVYAALLEGGLDYIKLDRWNRPALVTLDDSTWIPLFDATVHDLCDRKPAFDSGVYATDFGDAIENPSKCLLRLGCRGPDTFANCSFKNGYSLGVAGSGSWNPDGVGFWNNDRDNTNNNDNPGSWCVAAGAPCNGCSSTTFPDNVFGKGFFQEPKHSEMLAAGKIPGSASGATPEFEGKGVACYTCHAVNMPRKSKEWIK